MDENGLGLGMKMGRVRFIHGILGAKLELRYKYLHLDLDSNGYLGVVWMNRIYRN